MIRTAIRPLVLVAGLAIGMSASAEIIDRIAVKVNEDIVIESEVIESLAAYQQVESGEEVTRSWIIDRMVEKLLVVQEARKNNITVSPDDVDSQVEAEIKKLRVRLGGDDGLKRQLEAWNVGYDELRRQYRTRIRQEMMYMRLMHAKEKEIRDSVNISGKAILAYLEANKKDFQSAEVSVIFFPFSEKSGGPAKDRLETRARRALRKLQGGADFAEQAKRSDPSGGDGGFSFGRVRRSDLAPDLAKAVFSVKVGAIGKPSFFTGKKGFYILRVDDLQDGSMENSGDDIRQTLMSKKVMEKRLSWIEGLRAKAYVKVME